MSTYSICDICSKTMLDDQANTCDCGVTVCPYCWIAAKDMCVECERVACVYCKGTGQVYGGEPCTCVTGGMQTTMEDFDV